MIGEVEEANGRMEGQLLDRAAREASLNDQLATAQSRLTIANNEIAQLKVLFISNHHSLCYCLINDCMMDI